MSVADRSRLLRGRRQRLWLLIWPGLYLKHIHVKAFPKLSIGTGRPNQQRIAPDAQAVAGSG